MGFKDIAFGAIGYVAFYRNELSKALLFPFCLYTALDATELLELQPLTTMLVGFAGILVQTMLAITTHRIILLGPSSVSKWGLLSWSRREFSFALHLLVLGCLMILPVALAFFVPKMSWLISIPIICWLFGRLALTFPAIAIDKAVSFKYSWSLTKQHQLLMVLTVIVFPLILYLPAYFIGFIPYTFLISSLLSTLATVFMVSALSVAYRAISGEAYES